LEIHLLHLQTITNTSCTAPQFCSPISTVSVTATE
jgi:hypothetical protein